MYVAKLLEEVAEYFHLTRRHLHTDENTPRVSAVIAVMEETDIPPRAHAGEEIHQRARPFGKFKTVENFVVDLRRMPAHQMADMQLGHFVIGQIKRGIAIAAQLFDQLERLGARGDLDADIYLRIAGVVIAIVEFGNVRCGG